MKDQGMPLGDFRFCFPYEPCSQELKARVAALNAVTGAPRSDRSARESPDEGRGARPDRPEHGIGRGDSQGGLRSEAQ